MTSQAPDTLSRRGNVLVPYQIIMAVALTRKSVDTPGIVVHALPPLRPWPELILPVQIQRGRKAHPRAQQQQLWPRKGPPAWTLALPRTGWRPACLKPPGWASQRTSSVLSRLPPWHQRLRLRQAPLAPLEAISAEWQALWMRLTWEACRLQPSSCKRLSMHKRLSHKANKMMRLIGWQLVWQPPGWTQTCWMSWSRASLASQTPC